MANVAPVVRQFIACEDIIPDKHSVTLVRLILNIRPVVPGGYPAVEDEICVYVSLSEARGRGRMALQITQSDTGSITYSSPAFDKDFGTDPLHAHGIAFRLHNCYFPEAGVYLIQLLYNGRPIAQQELFAR